MKIVFLLLFISSVLGSLIPITAISPKELEELQGDPHITHKVVFHIRRKLSKDQYVSMGELVFGLFGGTTPITVKNFALLSEGTLGFGYEDSIFHRVIDGFVVQGGDFQYGQGYGVTPSTTTMVSSMTKTLY